VVDYHNAQHIDQVKRVSARQTAIECRSSSTCGRRSPRSCRTDATRRWSFSTSWYPAAPDVVIQIAHLAAAGAPSDPGADEALEVFIDAIARGDARATRLYFDAPSVSPAITITPDKAAAIASQIRRLGVQRILFGSDAPTGRDLTPRAAWDSLRKLPLTEAELRTIAANVAPYLRAGRR
jgi:hypothetical protein